MAVETEVSFDDARLGWRERLALILTHLWVVLLPIQIPLFDDGDRPLNLALSDLVLAITLFLTFGVWQIKPRVWGVWHFALPALMALNLLTVGVFTRYTILNKVVGILVLLAAYLLLTTVTNTLTDVNRLVRTFVLSVSVINVVALASQLSGLVIPMLGCQEGCLRFQGFYPDPNLYGSVLVVAWALMWGHTGNGKRFISAPVDLLIQVTALVGIVLTVSRSTWISLAVAILVGVVLKGEFSIRGWFGLSLLLVAVVFLAGDQFNAVGDLAGRTHSVDSRWVLIDQALKGFADTPIVGMGLGNFAEAHGQIIHNTPLWLAAELGILGIVVFTGFLLWFFRRGVAIYRHGGKKLRGVAIGLLLGNLAMFSFSLSVEALYQRHWWFLFAMTAVVHSFLEADTDQGSLRIRFLRA